MSHLSREQLIAWRDHPTDEVRAIVVPHLAACNACGALYAELIRTAPVESRPLLFDPDEFKARGYRFTHASGLRSGTRAWMLGAVAAAAAIVLLVFVPRWRSANEPASTTRGGSAVQSVIPAGDIDQLTSFKWSMPAGADALRLEVSDASGKVIFEQRVTGQELVAPPELLRQLQPGVEYRWMISRLNPRGETIESSPLTTFRIAR